MKNLQVNLINTESLKITLGPQALYDTGYLTILVVLNFITGNHVRKDNSFTVEFKRI